MITTLTLDKAGRVVLPKQLREALHLSPGDKFQLESEGEQITLRPVSPAVGLTKEQGVWVYQGTASTSSIPDLIDRVREQRSRETLG